MTGVVREAADRDSHVLFHFLQEIAAPAVTEGHSR